MLCTTAGMATEWQVLGARAQGMGGAGVALPNGAESAYWNPAGLGEPDNKSGVQVPFGAHVGVTGSAVAGARDLNNVINACNNGGAGCSQSNVNNALNELNSSGTGARVDAGTGLGFKLGRVTVFANDFVFAGAKPNADFSYTVAGNQLGVNNNSSIVIRGLNATEIGAAYGHEIPYVPGVFGGLTLKGIIGDAGFNNFRIGSNGQFGGSASPFKGGASSFQPSVDVGALWDMNRTSFLQNVWWRPRVGLTVHDINSPSFKYSAAQQTAPAGSPAGTPVAPNRYVLQSGARMGVSLQPLSFWNVAMDADLTRNITALEGVDSQMVALGTELNVFNRSWLNIPLRAGLSRNMALPGSKTAISAGAGFNFLHFNVDLGATVTPGTQTIQSQGQSQKLPNDVAFSGQLALLFGGSPTISPASTSGKPISN